MKTAHKAIAQTATVLIPFSLTMIAAGTVRFWSGWLFWIVFMLSSLTTGIYLRIRDPALLERRMRFGPLAEPRHILDEEHALSAELPDYDAYRSTIRYRLVPIIW